MSHIYTKKEYKKLLNKAKDGDADAQWEVAYYLTEGLSDEDNTVVVKPNPKKAYYWYRLSAKNGDSSAQAVLGDWYSRNEDKRDIKKAIYWYKKSYKQGNPIGAYNLACTYRDMQKFKKAFNWYKNAVKLKDYDALFDVGLCCLFGIGTEQNHKLAYRYLKKILSSNDSYLSQRTKENTQYWLGIFHLYGIGGAKKSMKKARVLLENADSDDDYDQANELLNLIGRNENIIKKKKYIKITEVQLN